MLPDKLTEAKRSAENCAFYPACYIAGDCDHEDWRKGTCGLPADIKAQVYARRSEESALRAARWRLSEQLRSEAMRGLHDDKLARTQNTPE